MKLISLYEPWATLMRLGLKTIETRSWATAYRGPLAIQASKGGLSRIDLFETIRDTPGMFFALHTIPGFMDWFNRGGKGPIGHLFPLGKIVATTQPTECCPTVASGQGLCLKWASAERKRQQGNEKYFGDYSYGRFGWITEQLFRLPEPIPFKAKQGLVNVPDDVIAEIDRQRVANA